ncbi:MAG: dehydratase [Clostridiales Family XIII bacterium]|nr:dehydratase [Clostridiales Family XIII bacterium]
MNKYHFDEIDVGRKEGFDIVISQEMMDSFRKITGDCNPLHNDIQFAVSQGYQNSVSYGMLTASFLSTLAGVYLPGMYSLIHSVSVDFVKPVIVGDELHVEGEVIEKDERFNTILLKVKITNGSNAKVVRGKMRIGVSK